MRSSESRDRHFMGLAIEQARAGIAQGQSPFGAAIVRDDTVIAATHNRVWMEQDITAHAEVAAIRDACRNLASVDLRGTTIYTTTEPCPMCFAACHWAGIERIVYGAGIGDAQAAGFNELPISNERMREMGGSGVMLTPGVLREECVALFREFLDRGGRTLLY